MKKVLIAGATGYLGRYLIEETKKQGYWVKALARKANKLDDPIDLLMKSVKQKLQNLIH